MFSINFINVFDEDSPLCILHKTSLARYAISQVRALHLTYGRSTSSGNSPSKDKMSYWVVGREGGYARGRGIQTFQVSQVNDGYVAV
jgi:hypothetical protein